MTQSETTTTCALDEALKHVFPLNTGRMKDATDDPDLIKEWWTRPPEAGIGLAARAQHVGEDAMEAERNLFGGI